VKIKKHHSTQLQDYCAFFVKKMIILKYYFPAFFLKKTLIYLLQTKKGKQILLPFFNYEHFLGHTWPTESLSKQTKLSGKKDAIKELLEKSYLKGD